MTSWTHLRSNALIGSRRTASPYSFTFSAAFFAIEHQFQTALAEQLGCRLRSGGCIEVDEHLRTSADGIWAIGDVVGEEQLVPIASAHGVKAGVDIHRTLPLPTGELPPS